MQFRLGRRNHCLPHSAGAEAGSASVCRRCLCLQFCVSLPHLFHPEIALWKKTYWLLGRGMLSTSEHVEIPIHWKEKAFFKMARLIWPIPYHAADWLIQIPMNSMSCEQSGRFAFTRSDVDSAKTHAVGPHYLQASEPWHSKPAVIALSAFGIHLKALHIAFKRPYS